MNIVFVFSVFGTLACASGTATSVKPDASLTADSAGLEDADNDLTLIDDVVANFAAVNAASATTAAAAVVDATAALTVDEFADGIRRMIASNEYALLRLRMQRLRQVRQERKSNTSFVHSATYAEYAEKVSGPLRALRLAYGPLEVAIRAGTPIAQLKSAYGTACAAHAPSALMQALAGVMEPCFVAESMVNAAVETNDNKAKCLMEEELRANGNESGALTKMVEEAVDGGRDFVMFDGVCRFEAGQQKHDRTTLTSAKAFTHKLTKYLEGRRRSEGGL